MIMSNGILRLKLDVMKIDKSALYKGEKGTYLEVSVLMKDEEDQYGNHGMAVQGVGEVRRKAGEKGPILGNAKWAVEPSYLASPPSGASSPADPGVPAKVNPDDDDFPF